MSIEEQSATYSTKDIDPAVLDKFTQARTFVGLVWPYCNQAVLKMVPRWTSRVPTMAVDKYWRLYLNPNFIGRKDIPVPLLALFIAGHELFHLVNNHADRLSNVRGEMVNINGIPVSKSNACHDLAINSNLQDFWDSGKKYLDSKSKSGLKFDVQIPTWILHPSRVLDDKGRPLPHGLLSEDYSELLDKINKSNGGKGVSGPGGKGTDGKDGKGHKDKDDEYDGNGNCCSGQCGSGGGSPAGNWEDSTNPDDVENNPNEMPNGVSHNEQKVIIKAMARSALDQESSNRGTVPLNLRRVFEKIVEPPKVPWQKKLRCALRSSFDWVMGIAEPTYSKVNRRTDGMFIIPGTHAPDVKFVVCLDSSGSMGKKDYQHIWNELTGVIKAKGCGDKIPVIVGDTVAQPVQYVRSINDVQINGGGGTDMPALISSALKIKGIKLVIVMTDGETPWPENSPHGVRVIACLTRRKTGMPKPPDWIDTEYCVD